MAPAETPQGFRTMPGTIAKIAGVTVPPAVPYIYRARRYPWAERLLARAEAVHGVPVARCPDCKRPDTSPGCLRYCGSSR